MGRKNKSDFQWLGRGVRWGTAEGLFLATPETANETRSPMSVNKAWSAACGR